MTQFMRPVVLCLAIAGVQPAFAADPLSKYPIDTQAISVSGISSGAFMANQLHIARSETFMGAGLIAGGLYACASYDVDDDGLKTLDSIATGACMTTPELLETPGTYAERVRDLEKRGWIDPVAALADDKVYLFTGASDKVVNSQTVRVGEALYRDLGVPAESILIEDHILPAPGAGHSWVTESFGVDCPLNEPPYITDCGYDQAGRVLQHIYGELEPRLNGMPKPLMKFDQTEFAPDGKTASNGLLDYGYLYVPESCNSDAVESCRLHVVLHGCKQSAQVLGEVFATKIGVNEWAETNRIVVLYPQARTISTSDFETASPRDLEEINPEGCWNWFGYGYDDYYPTTKGVQLDAIYKMVRRMTGAEIRSN